MAFQQKPDQGFFGKNKNRTNPKAPDYTGSCLLSPETLQKLNDEVAAGREPKLFIAGWKNKSNTSGEEYLSLRVNTPMGNSGASMSVRKQPPRQPVPEEDIPF